jgi:transcriptional regulator with XRE-family HTH domain
MRFNGAAGAAALRQRGITVSEAARRIGVERSHLSNILSGRRGAGAELVRKFAELTGEPPMVFVGPEDPKAAVVELAHLYGVTPKDLDEAVSA